MQTDETRVLYYHVIADHLPDIYPQGISVHSFFRQFSLLKGLGWRPVKLSDALDGQENGKNLCITLDDGLVCNFPALLQMMKSYALKPTLFLIGKCLDNHDLAWNHKLLLLRRYVPSARLDAQIDGIMKNADQTTLFTQLEMAQKDEVLDWLWDRLLPWTRQEYLTRNHPFFSSEQLKILVNLGAELALHSHSHPDFSRLDKIAVSAEINDNLNALEGLKLPYQRFLALPYGLPPKPEIEPILKAELKLKALLGTRYSKGDNQKSPFRWQRQNLERSAPLNLVEFFLKPHLRNWKDVHGKHKPETV